MNGDNVFDYFVYTQIFPEDEKTITKTPTGEPQHRHRPDTPERSYNRLKSFSDTERHREDKKP